MLYHNGLDQIDAPVIGILEEAIRGREDAG